jgi:Protein of unknown function (DUF3551)
MILFIIASAGATQHVEGWAAWLLETSMKTISMMAMASAIALLATCFTATPGAAKAGPITLREYYCLSYDEGGTNCSFTSYAQCEATASGIGAKCYGNSFRDDEVFRNEGPRAGEYQGPFY